MENSIIGRRIVSAEGAPGLYRPAPPLTPLLLYNVHCTVYITGFENSLETPVGQVFYESVKVSNRLTDSSKKI